MNNRSTSRESKLSNGVFRSSFGAWEEIEKFPESLSIILSIQFKTLNDLLWTMSDMEPKIWFDVARSRVQPMYLSYRIRNYHLRRHECATCISKLDLHRNPILKCKTEFPSLPTFISAWFGFARRGMIISLFVFGYVDNMHVIPASSSQRTVENAP